MSVFIVSPEHINVLLDAALRYTDEIGMTVYTSNGQALTIDRTNRDQVGQMLLDTNAASAGARHQEDTELYIYSYRTHHLLTLNTPGTLLSKKGGSRGSGSPASREDVTFRSPQGAMPGTYNQEYSCHEKSPESRPR